MTDSADSGPQPSLRAAGAARYAAALAALVLTALLAARPACAYHEFRAITERDLHAWSHWAYRQALVVIDGPQTAPFIDYGALDCRALYERRLAHYREKVDPEPAFTDDPRNQAAIFLGTLFTPAFYYLPYSALKAYLNDSERVYRETRIDALSYASAGRDCFLK